MKKRLLSLLTSAGLLLALPLSTHAAVEGLLFQPNGENLVIQPPLGWRLAYMNGDPNGAYVVEFLPPNESHDSWREGYMMVQRGPLEGAPGSGMARQIVQRVLGAAQLKCAGRFISMQQKDSFTNGAATSVNGGFCDRVGATAPHGEGSVIAVIEGVNNLFLVQFSWRPPTENSLKDYTWRITPEGLQQYLNLLNQATLCGGSGQAACPR